MLEPDSPWRRIASLRYGAKAGVAAVVGSLALGGVAAAATGTMPGPLQDVAHFLGAPSSVSAASESGEPHATESSSETAEPKESQSSAPTSTTTAPTTGTTTTTGPTTTDTTLLPTTGPDPLGPAAFGLCHAFGNKTWGNGAFADPTATPPPDGRKPDNPSVAYANLKAAAATVGDGTVDGFCTVVLAHHGVPSPWPTADSTTPTDPSVTTPTVTTPTAPAIEPDQEHRNGNGNGQGHGNGHSGDRSNGHGRGRG